MQLARRTLFCLLAIASAWLGLVRAQSAASAPAQEKTAGAAYKNVQVFKDVPESQLIQAMFFMKASLGVNCTHCHVDFVDFDKDDRPAKQTARRMILMVRDLNQQNFAGRTVVTCYTCHRGETPPSATLPFAPTSKPSPAPRPATPAVLPTVDQIFERYLAATGGTAAFDRVTTLAMTGTKTSSEGWTAPLERLQTSAGKFVSTFELHGPWRTAFDGTNGWGQDNQDVHPLAGRDLALERLETAFLRPTQLRAMFDSLAAAGTAVIGDRATLVVNGVLKDAGVASLFFDPGSGWLVRVSSSVASPLGAVPEAFDLDDYRRVGDITIPFAISHLKPDFSDLDRFSAAKPNVAIDEARFRKPAGG